MPTFKISYFFQTNDSEGWSENYYVQETDIQTAATFGAGNIAPRMALSPNNVSLIYARASDVAVKGDSLILPGTYPVVGTYTLSTGETPLEANSALMIRIFATALVKGRVFLRGLSSGVIVGRDYGAPALFVTRLAAYFAGWATFAYVRHRTSKGPPPVYTYVVSTSLLLDGVSARKPGRPFGQPRGRKAQPGSA